MSETLKPETAEQVLDAVKWAAASESPLAVKGQGSKEGFGRAIEADCRLDLSGPKVFRKWQPYQSHRPSPMQYMMQSKFASTTCPLLQTKF